MKVQRGSVYWWYCPEHQRKHIQAGVRPAVVVSNNCCNEYSGVVTIVPLSSKIKKPYPQQVPVILVDSVSIALCDQVTAVPVDELSNHICDLKDYQMDQIDTALAYHLGFVSREDRPYSLFAKVGVSDNAPD